MAKQELLFAEEVGQAFEGLTKCLSAKQVGVIVHGGGLDVEAWEEEAARVDGNHVMRCEGHTRIYRMT